MAHSEIKIVEGLVAGKERGRGCYGTVYEVRVNGVPCIAKRLHDILVGRGGQDPVGAEQRRGVIDSFRRECDLHSSLRHPNIVQFMGVHYGRDEADISLIMEYMHMDLDHCMKAYPNIPLSYKTNILRDVAYGLAYLHSIPIIHRDLNAGNVLLTESLRAKIADLGVAKLFDKQAALVRTRTLCPGAPDFMSPESLSQTPRYSDKLDIFSFGHLAIYLINQKAPYVQDSTVTEEDFKKKEMQVGKRRSSLNQMGGLRHPLFTIIVQCLRDIPDQRPSSRELARRMEEWCKQQPSLHINTLETLAELKQQSAELEALNSRMKEKDQIINVKEQAAQILQAQLAIAENSSKEFQQQLERTVKFNEEQLLKCRITAEMQKKEFQLQINKLTSSSIKPEENDCTKKEDEETVSPKESDASSTDAPAKPEAKPISTRIKHPMTKFPKTLHEFGYTFKDGKLQNISSGEGEGFVFEVIRGDKTYNQQHYETLGEVITEHVYTLLESETNLQRIPVPIPNPKQQGAASSSFFFASKDYLTNPKMMVLIHGSGVVRAGQWARRLIINDCLDSGTQLPFIKRAVTEGYSVVVLNTNLNYQHIVGEKKSVKGNSTPEEHAKYVWKNFITKSSASKIYIVAHSYGGIVTTELANECFKEFQHLVKKIAFTDSEHSVQRIKRTVKPWIKENAINWVSSNDPLDHPQQTLRNDVPRVSAGTNKHEETSWFSFASIFAYFKEELEKATEDDAHVPDVSAGTMQDNAQTQDDPQLCTTEPTS